MTVIETRKAIWKHCCEHRGWILGKELGGLFNPHSWQTGYQDARWLVQHGYLEKRQTDRVRGAFGNRAIEYRATDKEWEE